VWWGLNHGIVRHGHVAVDPRASSDFDVRPNPGMAAQVRIVSDVAFPPDMNILADEDALTNDRTAVDPAASADPRSGANLRPRLHICSGVDERVLVDQRARRNPTASVRVAPVLRHRPGVVFRVVLYVLVH
jgi:hypothetical protein